MRRTMRPTAAVALKPRMSSCSHPDLTRRVTDGTRVPAPASKSNPPTDARQVKRLTQIICWRTGESAPKGSVDELVRPKYFSWEVEVRPSKKRYPVT